MAEIDAKPSRLKLALLNGWNLAALGGAAALAVVLKSPVPLLAFAGVEVGWLAFATRPRASRALFVAAHAAADAAAKAAARARKLKVLKAEDAERAEALEARRADILRLAGDNTHVAREVLLAELARLEDVVDAFMEVAAACARSEAYLGAVDLGDLESETRRYEDDAARAADADKRALAHKNLEVLLRRRAQIEELRGRQSRGRAQLDLIESTFRMIGNEVMLMRDTGSLRDQLDDLVVGVQAVREMSTDVEPQKTRPSAAQASAARASAAQGRR
jgi:hypothetical protein